MVLGGGEVLRGVGGAERGRSGRGGAEGGRKGETGLTEQVDYRVLRGAGREKHV